MNNFDTFLPSGAFEQRRPHIFSPAMTSPGTQIPRSVPPTHLPNFPARRGYSTSPHASGTPISPPKTRSASADDDSAALIEDFRTFTKKIREQAKGERAHLVADRARADEIMEEERELWEQERNILKARIEQLEAELASKNGSTVSTSKSKPALRMEYISASGSGSSDGRSPASSIPQESGRNPDGSPFYAPAPTNPSRSFNLENQEIRIDSLTEPRETPIRVTSKSLRPVDFGIQSPERQAVQDLSNTMIGESIDISLIQPTLDGVPIKTSAVDPIFAATVLSPHPSASPSKQSPTIQSPECEKGPSPPGTVRRISNKKIATLEVQAAPEDRRLTMHAGHTPNHSISKFELESGNATPTQAQSVVVVTEHIHHTSMDSQRSQIDGTTDDDLKEDPELTGPLAFTADATSPSNDVFARELLKRLSEEALLRSMKSDDPSAESLISDADASEDLDQVSVSLDRRERVGVGSGGEGDDASTSPPIDGLPMLKMRPSANFGKPFGTL